MGHHEHDHSDTCSCTYCERERVLRDELREAKKELNKITHEACDQLLVPNWGGDLIGARDRVIAARKKVEQAYQALRS